MTNFVDDSPNLDLYKFFSKKNFDILFFYSFKNIHLISVLALDPYLFSLGIMYPSEPKENALQLMLEDIKDIIRKNALVSFMEQVSSTNRRERPRSCFVIKGTLPKNRKKSKYKPKKVSFVKITEKDKRFEYSVLNEIQNHSKRNTRVSFNSMIRRKKKKKKLVSDTLSIFLQKRKTIMHIDLLDISLKVENLTLKEIKKKAKFYSENCEKLFNQKITKKNIHALRISKTRKSSISEEFYLKHGVNIFYSKTAEKLVNKFGNHFYKNPKCFGKTPVTSKVTLCLYNPEDIIFNKMVENIQRVSKPQQSFHYTNRNSDYSDLLKFIINTHQDKPKFQKKMSHMNIKKRHSSFLKNFIKGFKRMSIKILNQNNFVPQPLTLGNDQLSVFLPENFDKLPNLISDCENVLLNLSKTDTSNSPSSFMFKSHLPMSTNSQKKQSSNLKVVIYLPVKSNKRPSCLNHMKHVSVLNAFNSSSYSSDLFFQEHVRFLTSSSKFLFYLWKSELLFTKVREYPESLTKLYSFLANTDIRNSQVLDNFSNQIFQNILLFNQMTFLLSSFLREFRNKLPSHPIFKFISKVFRRPSLIPKVFSIDDLIHFFYHFTLNKESFGNVLKVLPKFSKCFDEYLSHTKSTQSIVHFQYFTCLYLLELLYPLLKEAASDEQHITRLKPSFDLKFLYSVIACDFPSIKKNTRFERFFKELKQYMHVESFNHVYHIMSKNTLLKIE
jgi:hypothetical protein